MESGKNDKWKLNLDKLVAYAGIFGFVFLFWSYWKDIHLQIADVRERVACIEKDIEHLKMEIER